MDETIGFSFTIGGWKIHYSEMRPANQRSSRVGMVKSQNTRRTDPLKQTAFLITAFVLGGLAAHAQNPISDGQKMIFNMVKGNIVKAAEKMPEENYSFKP